MCIYIYIYHHITGLYQGYEDHSYPSALEPGRRSISDFLHGSLDLWPWKLRLWAHVFWVLLVFSKLPSGKLSHNYGKSSLQISLSLSQGEHNLTNIWLGVDLPLWKMTEFVSWDDDIPNMMGKKSCSKPPTSFWVLLVFSVCVCVRACGYI